MDVKQLVTHTDIAAFDKERYMDNHLISYSKMNEDHLRHDLCYLYLRKERDGKERDVIQSIHEFRNGKDIMTRRAFIRDKMTVFNDNGNVAYEGGYEDDPTKGYGRSGEGTEYNVDGNEGMLSKGDFANDKFHGKGSIFMDGYLYSEGHSRMVCFMDPVISCMVEKRRRFDPAIGILTCFHSNQSNILN